jgi:hypothetical protein
MERASARWCRTCVGTRHATVQRGGAARKDGERGERAGQWTERKERGKRGALVPWRSSRGPPPSRAAPRRAAAARLPPQAARALNRRGGGRGRGVAGWTFDADAAREPREYEDGNWAGERAVSSAGVRAGRDAESGAARMMRRLGVCGDDCRIYSSAINMDRAYSSSPTRTIAWRTRCTRRS